MSKLGDIKKCVLDILKDNREYSAQELREEIEKRGVRLEPESSAFRTAMYQLRNSGLNIISRERGVYCIKKEEEEHTLKGFIVLKPIDKSTKCCVYIHDDGKIVLNGRLNGEIESRRIEIRIAEGGDRIALVVNGENCHKFTKSGHVKNCEIVKVLKKKRVSFPVCFEMDKEDNIWIGKLKKVNDMKK